MTNETNCCDPVVTAVVWRGQRSALAAWAGVPVQQLAGKLARHGNRRRGGGVELQVQSPVALRTLRDTLRRPDEP